MCSSSVAQRRPANITAGFVFPYTTTNREADRMDVLTWLAVLVLALIAGAVGGAIGANVTVRQTVAADQRRLQRMGDALGAATGEVRAVRDMLRSAGRG